MAGKLNKSASLRILRQISSMSIIDQASAEIYTSLPDGTDRQQVTATADNEIGVDWGVDGG
jgi:hypothetical protein